MFKRHKASPPVPAAGASTNSAASAKRIQLLHHEIDILTAGSVQRQEALSNKASFLAVAAGVILTGLTAQFWSTPPLLMITAITFTVAALGLSAAALVPTKAAVLDGRRIVDKFADTSLNNVAIEASILDTKTSNLVQRNKRTGHQALIVILGYWALTAAALSFGAGFVIHYSS